MNCCQLCFLLRASAGELGSLNQSRRGGEQQAVVRSCREGDLLKIFHYWENTSERALVLNISDSAVGKRLRKSTEKMILWFTRKDNPCVQICQLFHYTLKTSDLPQQQPKINKEVNNTIVCINLFELLMKIYSVSSVPKCKNKWVVILEPIIYYLFM